MESKVTLKSFFRASKKAKIAAGGIAVLAAATAIAQAVNLEDVLKTAQALGAFDVPTHPLLERAEKDEAESIKTAAAAFFAIQMATEPQSRDAHAKGHACTVAQFKIREDVPAELSRGLFAQKGKTLDAIIRLSNGSGTTRPDGIPDGRGFAIKLIGGAMGKNLLGTGETQDFLLVNNENFFLKSAKDYGNFEKTIAQDKNPNRFFLERTVREALEQGGVANADELPMTVVGPIMAAAAQAATNPGGLKDAVVAVMPEKAATVLPALAAKLGQLAKKEAPTELKIALQMAKPSRASLRETYHSMVSFLLASPAGQAQDTAVKYAVIPVDCRTREELPAQANESTEADALRMEVAKTLEGSDACFNFTLQALPKDMDAAAKVKLVENPQLVYGTERVTVAEITIPRQVTNTPEKLKNCENLSFNPWQSGAAHKPLGALNRARKLAVTASSIRRHLVTGAARVEPTSVEVLESR